MEDMSSGENLCLKISGHPIAWKKPGCFPFSPALSSAEELSGDCIIAILKLTCQRSLYKLERPRTQQRAQSSPQPGSGIHPRPGRAPLHPALDPQGTAMGNILPSSLLPLQEWLRDLCSAPPAPWLVAHVTGVLIVPVGAGSWCRGNLPPKAAVWLQRDVWTG